MMTDAPKKETRGGPRFGPRKKKPEHLRKKPITIKLPPWLIERLAAMPGSTAVIIESALCKVHGWTKPPEKSDD